MRKQKNDWGSRLLLIFIGLFFCVGICFGQDPLPTRPSPARLVNNLSKAFPQFLTTSEEAQLENKLEKFARESGNQIVVLIVDDLSGYDINSFGTSIIHIWGIGQVKEDNGVLLVIKPTGGENERDAYIAVGYGLEGAIPDITAHHIVEKELIPRFKEQRYYEGVDACTDVLMKLAIGEYDAKNYDKQNDRSGSLIPIICIIIFLIWLYMRFGNKGGGGGFTIGRSGFYGGGFGGIGGSWGGGSSWGGGGFGGFGGGSSGGGGGGGKW
jgi:uncharacterized protein